MANLIQPPFQVFTDGNGAPLEDGYIFIGEAGLSPVTNPLQAYWDAALSVPASNIRTKGGYPWNSGTPGRLYVETNYSILVKDKKGTVVYTQLNAVDTNAVDPEVITTFNTVADLREYLPAEDYVQASLNGATTVGDELIGPLYYWNPYSNAVDNGISVIRPTAALGDGRWLWINNNAPIGTTSLDETDVDTDTAGAYTWSIATVYAENDEVYYSSIWYKALQASTSDQPDTSPLYWEAFVKLTLDYANINQIFLVDTSTSALTLVAPDGDYQGQEIIISNDGTKGLTVSGSGITDGVNIGEKAYLTWIDTSWDVVYTGTIGTDTVAVGTITEAILDAGTNFPNDIYLDSNKVQLLYSNTHKSSFATPATTCTGLAFDGTNLISCDSNTDLIYIHDGVSSTISSSFATPATNCVSITFDGTNLISCDIITKRIYIHEGVSSTISSSFDTPATTCQAITFDGTNLISCDRGTNLIYIHDGVSSTISSSFATELTATYGLAFDGTSLISSDNTTNLIYTHIRVLYV